MDGWMGGWTDGWVGGWVKGWMMDAWVHDVSLHLPQELVP